MTNINETLRLIRAELAPSDESLDAARERRTAVLRIAGDVEGVRDTFRSGSLAHGTANCPIHRRDQGLDADSGLVLDRRTFRTLGPDSDAAIGPAGVVSQFSSLLRSNLGQNYPRATVEVGKRAITVTFNEPLSDRTDPSVDLIVALERRDAPGLWIPRLTTNTWDASDPQGHTSLFASGSQSLRTARARAVRLAKAANKRDGEPYLCSFNVEAFGLMFVEPGMSEADALAAIWTLGAADLRQRATPDPAGVSAPIQSPRRAEAASAMDSFADALRVARDPATGSDEALRHLRSIWPDHVPLRQGELSKAAAKVHATAGGIFAHDRPSAVAVAVAAPRAPKRAFGG